MTWDHIAIFLGGVITGELGILFVLGMCRSASCDSHACQPATRDDATRAPSAAPARVSADGLPLSEYMRPTKRFRCSSCRAIQIAERNPTTCQCGNGVFEMMSGPMTGALVDADRSASAIITGLFPAPANDRRQVAPQSASERAPRV